MFVHLTVIIVLFSISGFIMFKTLKDENPKTKNIRRAISFAIDIIAMLWTYFYLVPSLLDS